MPILIVAVSIHTITLLLWYSMKLPSKRKHWLYFCLSVALCTFTFILTIEFNLFRTGIFLFIAVVMLAFRLSFSATNQQAIYFSTFYLLSAYSSRGIIASLFSLIHAQSLRSILREPTYYKYIWLLAIVLSLMILLIRSMVTPKSNRIRQLFNLPNQLIFVSSIRVVLIIYLMLIDDGRFREVPAIWFPLMYIISSIMVKIVMVFVEDHALRISDRLEYEMNTRHLEQQLTSQLRHYQSYQNDKEKAAKFLHDYRSMMTSVKALIHQNENEKAVMLMNEIYNEISNCSTITNTYSDNILLDSILHDAAVLCEEKQIAFHAMVHLPSVLPIRVLDKVRLITNILNNSIEACGKVPAANRFVDISSASIDGWTSIKFENSYDGLASYDGKDLPSSKPNKEAHGYGLRIVRQITEEIGGIIQIETKQEEKRFILVLHIPEKKLNSSLPESE